MLRVAIVSGRGGKGFCAGADLIEFGTAPSLVSAHRSRRRRDLWGLMAGMRKPLVAAVHGYVIGAGVEMACLCDIRVATEDAVFAMPEVTIGMIPGAGGTQTLPRAIGIGRSMARFLAGRGDRMSAAEAASAGLVHRVVTRSGLEVGRAIGRPGTGRPRRGDRQRRKDRGAGRPGHRPGGRAGP